jgi:outer membrane protein OmpA-like peptidoglycan-associated protein
LFAASFAHGEQSAHGQTPPTQEFSVQRFEPAPGPNNFLGVETLRMEGDWHWSAGLFFNYSRDPFVVQTCVSPTSSCSNPAATQQSQTHVVQDMLTWDVLASVSPRPWLQLGLRLPVSYVSGAGLDTTNGGPYLNSQGVASPLKAGGVGDPYLEGKARLLRLPGDLLLLGVGADISFITHATNNANTNFIGDSSPVTGGIRGIAEGSAGPWSYGANLRGIFREDVTVGTNKTAPDTTVGSEFRYGVAVSYRVSPIFEVLAEGFGATGFRNEPGTNSLEVDGAVRIRPLDSDFAITVGGGGGALRGVGVPSGRAFAGLLYARGAGDRDHDGIPDDVDKCPTIPEDFDGFEDHDGCPEPDNDGDRIPDDKDLCPNEPETINGFQDADGCPDEVPDRDHDGIPDNLDKCPDAGGPDIIRNPKSPYYGCPDRDHDGIPDHLDKCPDVPEPTDDLFDGSGCPHIRDTDKDGIPDEVDACPTVPGEPSADPAKNGCPQAGPKLVELSEAGIKILERVEFATGKDKIQGVKSFQVLDAVASILGGRKDIELIEVQGHTDNAGIAVQNRKLSQKRAEAVVKYLVGKGIDAGRLKANGLGPDKPIADNKTAAGRQQNRRVEFVILKGAPKGPTVVPAPTGPAAPAGGPPAARPPAAPPPAAPPPAARPPAAPPKKN